MSRSCKESVKGVIVDHWTVMPKYRTQQQNEAERYLFTIYVGKNRYLSIPGIRFSRWHLFFASFIVQFCIGSLYSWSVFNKPIDKLLYHDSEAERAVNAFYTSVGVFGMTTAIMGPWIERHGPRAGVCLGTTAFFIGNVLVAISLQFKSMAGVIVGYGVFCGFGMGLCYIAPVSALQKWFPDFRGTAGGFAIVGYGAGAVVWGKAYLPIMRAVGLPATFLVVAVTMCSALFFCAIVLRTPDHSFIVGGLNMYGEAMPEELPGFTKDEPMSVMAATAADFESIPELGAGGSILSANEENGATLVRRLTTIQAIKSIDFVFMYIMFAANELFGLIVLSKLSSMCTDLFGKNEDQAANIVSINGVLNCAGRLFLPVISDFLIKTLKFEQAFGRKCIFYYTLATQVVIIGTIPYVIDNKLYNLFLIQVFVLTASYGGGFGTIPSFLTDMFGVQNIGAMHGLILTSWSLSGVIGGILFNNTFRDSIHTGHSTASAYEANFHTMFFIVLAGLVAVFLVRTDIKSRFAGGYRYTICGCAIINIQSRNKTLAEATKNDLLVHEGGP